MRYRVYAISLLFILVFYMLRPVMPYIQYAVFKEYIAKNLCVNKDKPKSCCEGKCYLEKQIKKSSETTDAENKNTNHKVQNNEVKEFLSSHVSIPKAFAVNTLYFETFKTIITTISISSIFVPPEA
jgi:hypothetical protein